MQLHYIHNNETDYGFEQEISQNRLGHITYCHEPYTHQRAMELLYAYLAEMHKAI